MTAADGPNDEPTDAPRTKRGFFGWLRSFAAISIVGAALATVVLLIGVSSLLAKPSASRGVLPIDPGPLPTGADPQPESSPTDQVSASPSPSPVRVVVSRSPGVSKSPVPSASVSPLVLAPVRYEAESATASRGRTASDHAGFSGSGFVDYENVAGSYVEFAVTAPSARKVTLRIRFANGGGASRPMDILVNGTLAADDLAFPQTGGWPNWDTRTLTVTLVAGANQIRLVATNGEGGPNVDYLEVA
ncbi:hypothetical protein F4553_002991 [Allocatelliglobosispora scoriae]|uniref:CBM6 domain-containing protein n=1 Tax=Allocatelliglobosispora scoriae TaxID=643052 RepID=A0A841BSA9_9ACTN|nr:CBM35 domain-containing protein [Allocatelliglobosispora scoriae]MBB5869612.1 hypothetical protein [Allocatelliglobosispora scoriae]